MTYVSRFSPDFSTLQKKLPLTDIQTKETKTPFIIFFADRHLFSCLFRKVFRLRYSDAAAGFLLLSYQGDCHKPVHCLLQAEERLFVPYLLPHGF